MLKSSILKLGLPVVSALLLAVAARADIGVNFLGRGWANTPLGAGETAGVLPQQNWNNQPTDNNTTATTGNLNDHAGAATGVTLSYAANDNWNSDGDESDSDYRLMKGILKAGNPAGTVVTLTFNNLVPNANYKLIMNMAVNGDDVRLNLTAGGTTYYVREVHQFRGTYFRAVNTVNADINRDKGNYVQFDSVAANGSGQLVATWQYIGGGDGAAVPAVQLIPLAGAPRIVVARGGGAGNIVYLQMNEPVVASLLPTDYSISGGVSVLGVAYDAAKNVVILTTSLQIPGTTYTVTVPNPTTIVAAAGGANLSTPSATYVARNSTVISVNFTGANAAGAPTSLLASDVAGVFAVPNWNNILGNNNYQVPLADADGVATPVTVSFDADESWGSGTGTSTPNRKLMNGYLGPSNDGNPRPIVFRNVPSGTYNVIVYNLRDGQDNHATTVNADFSTTLHVRHQGAGDFNDIFVRGTSTDPNNRQLCNYVQFDNVTPVNGTIEVDVRSETFRAPCNGIQLVDNVQNPIRFVKEPVETTIMEGQTVTFSAMVVGSFTHQVQWCSNGMAIAGATNLIYSTTASRFADGALYSVKVSNNIPSGAVSSNALLHVIADIIPPTLVAAYCDPVATHVNVVFSEPMRVPGVVTPGNYSLVGAGGPFTVTGAILQADNKTVVLTLNNPLIGTSLNGAILASGSTVSV